MTQLISIIMTTYNRAAFIEESINSVRAQTHADWELLIEDDGSDDDTELVVKAINDERIFYTRHPRTAITGRLKNSAMKRANGSYIAFIDSDDLWVPGKLEMQLKLLNEYPDKSFSISNWVDFRNDPISQTPYYSLTEGVYTGNIFKDYCTAKRLAHIQTLLFKKDCLEATGMFNENRMFTDYSFIGNLAYHYEAVVINKPLFLRRLHNNNNVNTGWIDDFKEYQETVLSYVAEGRLSYKSIKNTLLLSYINLGEKYLRAGNKALAINSYLRAWKCKPLSIVPIKKLIKTLFL